MSALDPAKHHAARAAVQFVQDGMIVGLGSGSTAAIAIELLGERCRQEALEIIGVPTSEHSAQLARAVGLKLADLNACSVIDIIIDGADEVDSAFRMIKGRGGALLREKLVAAASKRCVYIVGPGKRVAHLGTACPLPVEIAAFDVTHTSERIRGLGATPRVRLDSSGRPFLSDGGNVLLDCDFGPIQQPEQLDRALHTTLGVFETGLFLGLCDTLIVGSETGAEVFENPA